MAIVPESPFAQLSASLRVLHFVSPLRVCFGRPLVSQRPYEGEPVFLIHKPKGARYMKPHPKPAADVPKWAALLEGDILSELSGTLLATSKT